MNGAELYRRIGEKQALQPKYKYEVGTHLYKRGDKTYYRVKISEYKYIKNLPQYRRYIHEYDYQITDVYDTRAKIISKAKMDAGLWRVKTKVYAY